MLYVRVELWPGGHATQADAIGHVAIANLTPPQDPATYLAVRFDAALNHTGTSALVEHDRSHGWSELLRVALDRMTNEVHAHDPVLTEAVVTHARRELSASGQSSGAQRPSASADAPVRRPRATGSLGGRVPVSRATGEVRPPKGGSRPPSE